MDIRHTPVTAVTLFAALATSALALAAPQARAGFASQSTPIVSAVGANASGGPVAIGADGTSTVVWDEGPTTGTSSVVKGRTVAATGTPGPVVTLSELGQNSSQATIAGAPDGSSFVAWRERTSPATFTSIKGRWIGAGGALGPIVTILAADSQNDAGELRVVVATDGVASVVWRNQRSPSTFSLRRIAPDGALAPTVPGIGQGNDPVAVALPDGSTLVAWRDGQIKTNVVSPSGTVRGVVNASIECGLCASPGLAVDREGNGLVAWRRQGPNTFAIEARRLTTAGHPTGGVHTVEPLLVPFVGSKVSVAADSNDDFLVTWDRAHQGWARRIDSTGTWAGPARQISSSDEARDLVPVLDDRGTGAAAWHAELPHSEDSVRARLLDASGQAIGGQAEIAPRSSRVEAASAPAAGLAAFVSTEFADASVHHITLSRHLVTPACSSSTATVVQGKPILTPLRCAGPGVESVKIATQPAHGKVGRFGPAGLDLAYAPAPGYSGPDSFSYRAVNDAGESNVATVTIAVGKDTVRPRVTSVALKRGKIVPGKPRPLSFALAFSEPARAKVTVRKRQRDGTFRIVGSIATTRFRLAANPPITGELAKRIRRGGRFRTFAVATDLAANRSARKLLKLELPVRR
jgi:hypothetical protein